MADKKISELDALTGAAVATDDQLIIVDTSAGLTKNITIDEFKNALDTSTGFVRITGDTMTGDLDVQGTVTADGLTVDDGFVIVNDTTNDNQLRLESGNTYTAIHADPSNSVSSTSLQFKIDGSEAMRIDSSGNVGIGTSSPSSELHLANTSTTITLEDTDNPSTNTISSSFGQLSLRADTGNELANSRIDFKVDGTERMRIDSSGNLLVGKTTGSISTEGVAVFGSGLIEAAYDGGKAMTLNRLTSDGDIVQFRKDGSTVGSIGSDGGSNLVIKGTGNSAALLFNHSNSRIEPYVDNVTDLGRSLVRFKDLYLSGGVYLGGTGSANKLDDYETGTWTPVSYNATTATYSHQSGSYVRVGDLVYIQGRLVMSSLGDGSSTRIGGLPFTQSEEATINVSKLANCSVSFYYFGLRVAGDTLYAHIQDGLDANITINNGFLGNTTEIQFSGTYRAV